MKDEDKTKEQLIAETVELRRRLAEVEVLARFRDQIDLRTEGRSAGLVDANEQPKAETGEVKEAETDRSESEAEYRTLLEIIEEGYFEVDLAGNLTLFNDEVCKVLGYSREELTGMNNRDYTTPGTAREMYRLFNEIYRTGKPARIQDYEVFRKDGTTRVLEISVSLVRDSAGEPVGFRGIGRDITDRKRAEEALRESEERYRTVLEASPDPVVVYDIEGRVLYFNPAFTTVFGWTLEERLARKMDIFVPEESWPETRMMINRVLAGKSFSGIETRRYTKEGKLIPVSLSGAIYRGRDGNPAGSVINLRDISERTRLEAQLQQAQKMEAVGTLAGGIAHDFNNLLQAIKGYAQLLLAHKEQDERGHRALQKIASAAEKGGRLTRQLLTFSRRVESERRPLDLNLEIQEMRNFLVRTIAKMVDIELNLADDLRIVEADPIQMEQVLMNMAVNAKDAMPEGGKIVIKTENVILDGEFCKTHLGAKPGEYVLLSISDNGHGMDKETLEHIFEPFYSTKEIGKGTGLGLAMVYGIVKNHHGHIQCLSELGEGTNFEIYLPISEQQEEHSQAKDRKASIKSGNETILLVDDEESIRELGLDVLGDSGYTVLTAVDGESALELYRKERESIDLIMLDLILPGMGGSKCLQELLRINPKTKVVIASGQAPDGLGKETAEAGARAYLGKPYDVGQMLQVVRQVLDGD